MFTRSITVAALALPLLGACMDRPVAQLQPSTNNVFVDRIPTARIERIDLLFMVDNSLSMADKQALLAEAVPQLVGRLVDPPCLSREEGQPPQRANAGQCPEGYKREFPPLADIHIGVITSALGSHGGNGCTGRNQAGEPVENDDHAYLMPLVRPAEGLTSYAGNAGFLAWDPLSKQNPPGTADAATLVRDFAAHVTLAGEEGCGYEASLEAWYRFLIDPEPPAGLRRENDVTVPTGVDQLLLEQRRAFLRPDSLVAVIMLTDENDCSVMDEGFGWIPMTTDTPMFRGSSDCARDPESPCCRLCGLREATPPDRCVPLAEDVECKKGLRRDDPEDVDVNLRCFDHKRRFGFDFLYPISRYVDGLRNTQIKNRRGELVANPLYTDLVTNEPATRTKELVFLAGIVGVPWQDIATPKSLGAPGLLEYLRAEQIPWDRILADPETGLPKDSLMIETTQSRVGAPPHPVTNALVAEPGAASPEANPINGHEHRVARELQYACTFRLDTDFGVAGFQPRTCDPLDSSCDCDNKGVAGQKPLCQDPNTGAYSNTQWFAKAYPGVRQLQVLKGLEKNAIVASICPKVLEPSEPSFGYNPAVDAITDVLADSLKATCLPRPLDVARDSSVPCKVVETTRPRSGQACDCSVRGRKDPDPVILPAVWQRMAELELCERTPEDASCQSFCVCEIEPAGTESDGDCAEVEGPLEACQCQETPANVVGYCYVDPGKNIGSLDLVKDCAESAPRVLRLVGTPETPTPKNGSTVFVACAGANVQ